MPSKQERRSREFPIFVIFSFLSFSSFFFFCVQRVERCLGISGDPMIRLDIAAHLDWNCVLQPTYFCCCWTSTWYIWALPLFRRFLKEGYFTWAFQLFKAYEVSIYVSAIWLYHSFQIWARYEKIFFFRKAVDEGASAGLSLSTLTKLIAREKSYVYS